MRTATLNKISKNMAKEMYFFPITIEPMEEGGFFADCSTLQGCHAEGASYSEVIENIQDVIKTQIQVRQAEGDFIPSVSFKSQKDFRFSLPSL